MAEEDATGRRKKASITQMLNEHKEEELAEWWREHPGLYDKSNEMYRGKEKKDRLIADKAKEMAVRGFDANMLAGWMKNMRTMYGKEEKKAKWKSGTAPPVLTSRHRLVVETFQFLRPHLKVWKVRKVLVQVSYNIYYYFFNIFFNNNNFTSCYRYASFSLTHLFYCVSTGPVAD